MAGRKSCSEKVYEEMKKRILSLEYPPGYVLTETGVAEELGVSRTPVRVAIKLLEKDNLVEFTPNKGAFVSQISFTDVNEIFMLREMIEGYCAGKAAINMNEESIAYLEHQWNLSVKKSQEGDFVLSSILGGEIHKLITGVVGNSRIDSILDNIEQDISRIQHLTSESAEQAEVSNREHKEIIDAIRNRNPQLADEKMKKHIEGVRQAVILEYLRRK